ncbi:MAG: amino acid ABC transporter substrate-binding protein, partial [Candidatus Electrothrix sp. AW2]|nr:amino acid ABC transporter substrate-binding protein [Candidatus Electrothrix gigas]
MVAALKEVFFDLLLLLKKEERMKINIFIKRHWRILAVEAILLILTIWAITALHSESNKLYIAVVLDQESSRITVKNALKIYAERINKYGGIQTKDTEGETEWKKLEFIWKYDEGIPEKAKEIAREVVNDKKYKFAAVIGHFNPETTAAAAKIYDNAKKTLLVPWSNIDINSQWIFQ